MSDSAQAHDRLTEQLTLLSDEGARVRFLNRHPELVSPDSVRRLATDVRRTVHIDPQRALAVSETALAIARRLGDPGSLAYGLRAKANALYSLHDLKESLSLYRKAAQVFLEAGDEALAGRTLSSSIHPLILLGRYDDALEAADRAQSCLERAGDEEGLSRLENNRANVFHRQGRLEEALKSYESSYYRLLPFKDEQSIGAALSNLAMCLIAMNDFHRALAAYERARLHCERDELEGLVSRADYNVAYLYFLRGRYGEALERLRTVEHQFRAQGNTYHTALCNLDLSDIYLELNMPSLAAELAETAREGFSEIGTKHEEGRCVVNQGIGLGQLGRVELAIDRFSQGRRLLESENNAAWMPLIDFHEASLLYSANRLFEARARACRGLSVVERSATPGSFVWGQLLLSQLALASGDVALARDHCDEAYDALATLESPLLDFRASALAGTIEEATGNESAAIEKHRDAARKLELLRGSLHHEELKMAFMKDKLAVYESLVNLQLRQAEASRPEVWGWMESAKSRALSERLARTLQGAKSSSNRESAHDVELRALREELNWYYHRIELEEIRSDSKRETLASLRESAKLLEKRMLDQLRAGGIGGEDSSTRGSRPHSVEEVRRHLSGRTLVEYYETRGQLVVAVLTESSLEIRALGGVEPVRALSEHLTFQLFKARLGDEYYRRFADYVMEVTKSHLKSLYDLLLAPVRGAIESRHLVFVPHGVLHHFPFHALFDGSRYLVDDFTISFAPSASVFATCQTRTCHPTQAPLVMAVPDERNPYIEKEARLVAAAFPEARLRLGADASLNALARDASGSPLVHIAAHGYFRADNPMFSAIRLGDGYLTLPDLYSLELDVDLVSLSGCGTGLSRVTDGDELVGLVRGLFQAGARSSLVTLWDVRDRAAADFMQLFYTNLQKTSASREEALREAMLQMRSSYVNPYYWAPYALVGRVGALSTN